MGRIATAQCRNIKAITEHIGMSEPRYLDFSSEGAVKRRRKLPHWEAEGVAYFITFRLADSMPKEVQERAKEYSCILERVRLNGTPDDVARAETDLLRFVERHLDAGYGSCLLRNEAAAKILWEALHFGEGKEFRLFAAAVMPNHVHAVVSLKSGLSLSELTHSWKSFAAHQVNGALGRTGRLWEPESYDHIVRSPASLTRVVRYVAENPRKAKLDGWPWVWPDPSSLTEVQDSD